MADAIVTTEEFGQHGHRGSGTGKPVYVQRLKGSSRRLGRFHELMRERGATRPFAGKIEIVVLRPDQRHRNRGKPSAAPWP